MKINVNDMVKVRLTPYGRELTSFDTDEFGYTSFHLWELMEIFGKCMYMGNSKIPFENNEIYFEEEEVKKEEVNTLTVSELQHALAALVTSGHGEAKIMVNQQEVHHAELVIKHITEPELRETFLVLKDE